MVILGKSKLSLGAKYGMWTPLNEGRGTINLGRNKHCECGSGKKHKRCCLGKIAFTQSPLILDKV